MDKHKKTRPKSNKGSEISMDAPFPIKVLTPEEYIRRALTGLKHSHPDLHHLLNSTLKPEPGFYVFRDPFPLAAIFHNEEFVVMGFRETLIAKFRSEMVYGLPLEVLLHLLFVTVLTDLASRPKGAIETFTANSKSTRCGLKAGATVFADYPRKIQRSILRVLKDTTDSKLLRTLSKRFVTEQGLSDQKGQSLKRRLFQLEWMNLIPTLAKEYPKIRLPGAACDSKGSAGRESIPKAEEVSLARLLLALKDEIIQATHLSIAHGVLDTWIRCGNKPHEPDFVAGLVLETAPLLYRWYQQILSPHGIEVSLASVYCHQRPKVRFDGMTMTACELGDLLFVHVHRCNNTIISRNALLYQAKRVSSWKPYKVHPKEQDQLSLYMRWPDFEYCASPPLKGLRNVTPKSRHAGAQYMLIGSRSPEHLESGPLTLLNTESIGSSMPDKDLCKHSYLANELFDFLYLRSGRIFKGHSESSLTNGWSQIVWDLLRSGFKRSFTRRRSGRILHQRYAGDPLGQDKFDGCCFLEATTPQMMTTVTTVLGNHDAGVLYSNLNATPPNRVSRQDKDHDQEGTGTSLIVIETNQGELE